MTHDEVNATTPPMHALLLDAHLKSSLVAIRSMGEKGIPVCAGSHRGSAMGLYSRYVTSSFVYPSPLDDRAGFVEAVKRRAEKLGKCVVFTFSDSTMLPVVDNYQFFRPSLFCALPSSAEDFKTAFDKGLTLKLAEELGVEVPETFWCRAPDELEAISRKLGYPIVLKPRRSVYWDGNSGFQTTSIFAYSASDLEVKFNNLLRKTGEIPILQKYIEGEETGVEFVSQNGRPIAACAHRRLRSASPTGGAGVITETVPMDYYGTGIRAQRLIAALHWSGPAMVEFKICKRTGIPKLMEINGRFWGSLPLAIAAGIDFPHLYYRLVCGENVSVKQAYKFWLISRHFWGDLANLRSALFHRDPMYHATCRSRLNAIRAFLSFPSCSPAVFDRRDVKPTLAEIVDTARVILTNRLGAPIAGRQRAENYRDLH